MARPKPKKKFAFIRGMEEFPKASEWGYKMPKTTKDFLATNLRQPPIRSTPLAVLQECRRKFLYAYRLGIQPKISERPLDMGSFVHLMLKQLFLGHTEDEASRGTELAMKQTETKIKKWADKAGFLPNGQDVIKTLEDLYEDYHKARAMAVAFWRFDPFPVTEWEVLKAPDGTPMVEVVLEARIQGILRPLICPCDLALVHKETGEVWIVDFKTTSWDPRIRAISTKFSPQLALYRLTLQAHLDDWARQGLCEQRTVVGSIHAIIKKPTIKYCPDTKDKGGFNDYIKRLIEWYKEQEEKNPDNPPMARDPNRFSNKALTPEFHARLKEYDYSARARPNIDLYYRAGDSVCLKYNRPCPYMLLCNSDPSMWPDLIRTHYEIRFREDEPDPLEDKP